VASRELTSSLLIGDAVPGRATSFLTGLGATAATKLKKALIMLEETSLEIFGTGACLQEKVAYFSI
jgi:hypothetical protein